MKAIATFIIKWRFINYPLNFLIVFIVWRLIFNHLDNPNSPIIQHLGERPTALFLFSAIMLISVTWKKRIHSLERGEVMVFGAGTGCWVSEGYYFLFFWIFSIRPGEVQNLENRDVKLIDFICRDKNGKKLSVTLDGDYEIEDADKFMRFKEEQMKDNVMDLLKRATVRIIGGLIYETEIIGVDLGNTFINDPTLVRTCTGRYGIQFTDLDPSVNSGNLVQDDLNQYRVKVTAEMKALYPCMSDQEIAEQVNLQLGSPGYKKVTIDSNGTTIPVINP